MVEGSETYRPEQFAAALDRPRPSYYLDAAAVSRMRPGPLSQSERDWAFAKWALARGESPEIVTAAIASYRRYEKHNPQYYAELTVCKAAQALARRSRQRACAYVIELPVRRSDD